MTDIKQTLATAFDDEPPLNIDRAAILKDGRRKTAFRRGYTAAAVLATVTAVAVPALLWSGAGGGSGGGDLQVASGQPSTTAPLLTTTAPPVPTTTTITSMLESPYTTRPGSPSSMNMPQPPKPVTPERAAELGTLLAGSGTIPPDAQGAPIPQDPMDPWTFRISDNNAYLSVTDVTTAAGRGMLLLHLRPGKGTEKCEAADTSCQELEYGGKTVAVSTQQHEGVTLVTVRTATPDGAVMSAQVSNSSDKGTPNGTTPPLTWEQLAKIATHPGFTF